MAEAHYCEHPECSRFACYGWGPPAVPQQHWWCPLHVPASFFDWLKSGQPEAPPEALDQARNRAA